MPVHGFHISFRISKKSENWIDDPQQAMERICEKMEIRPIWSIWSMDFYWKELGTHRNDDFLFFVKDQSSIVDKRCAIA